MLCFYVSSFISHNTSGLCHPFIRSMQLGGNPDAPEATIPSSSARFESRTRSHRGRRRTRWRVVGSFQKKEEEQKELRRGSGRSKSRVSGSFQRHPASNRDPRGRVNHRHCHCRRCAMRKRRSGAGARNGLFCCCCFVFVICALFHRAACLRKAILCGSSSPGVWLMCGPCAVRL